MEDFRSLPQSNAEISEIKYAFANNEFLCKKKVNWILLKTKQCYKVFRKVNISVRVGKKQIVNLLGR